MSPRAKQPLNIYIDAGLLLRLNRWLFDHEFPPSKTAAVEAALREFLGKREDANVKKR